MGWNQDMDKEMARQIASGQAIDLSRYPRTAEGEYIMSYLPSKNNTYCDSHNKTWIWSIGQHKETKQILASTNPSRFYNKPDYECMWLG